MVRTVLEKSAFKDLAIRVHNRDLMIDFYRNILKLRLLGEENAVVFFGCKKDKKTRLTLEETPEYRGRAVVGNPKLHVFQIRYDEAKDFDAVLHLVKEKGIQIEFAWKKEDARGVVLTDPENNRLSIYTSPTPVSGKSAEKVEFKEILGESETIDSVESCAIDYLKLNVPNLDVAKSTYEKIFEASFDEKNEAKITEDLTLALTEREGEDLIGNVDELWDIEFVEIYVEESLKMQTAVEHFEKNNIPYFADKKHKIITIQDASGIEWWFMNKE